MWTKSLIIIFVIFLTSSKACDVNQTCDINMDDENIKTMKGAMEAFTIALMNTMYSDTTLEGNVTFSATNVYLALFLLMVGSVDNAKNELIAALGLVDKDLPAMQGALEAIVTGLEVLKTSNIRSQEVTIENLSLGEALYVQRGLNLIQPFNDVLKKLDADSYPKDFANGQNWPTRKINQWINNQTGKRTPITITSTLDPSTKLFMATAAFFSAKFEDNFFDPAYSGVGTFTSATGQTNVILMSAYKKLFFFDDKQSYSAVQIPFQNKEFMLHIVLPYGNKNPTDFVKSFNMDHWKQILEQSTEVDIAVKIPKLAIAWTNSINDKIQALKVKEIFQGNNFSGMIEYTEGKLHIASFTQSAGLTINEVGVSMPDVTPLSTTQGAAAAPNNPPAFIVDRPCLILVRQIRSSLIVLSSFIRQL